MALVSASMKMQKVVTSESWKSGLESSASVLCVARQRWLGVLLTCGSGWSTASQVVNIGIALNNFACSLFDEISKSHFAEADKQTSHPITDVNSTGRQADTLKADKYRDDT